jgi:hypothetical protein
MTDRPTRHPTDEKRTGQSLRQDFKTKAVVRVGGGRGFIVGAEHEERHIITAAHCLPRERYPSPHLANDANELTVPQIAGPVTAKRLTIWGEMCVLNLCDDVAVLREPDGIALSDKTDKYQLFTKRAALTIGAAPPVVPPRQWDSTPGTPAWVLSLDLTWKPCTVHSAGRFLATKGAKIESGMSGSPILNDEGAAIGLLSTGGDDFNVHPSLADCLPQWLLRDLTQMVPTSPRQA